MEILSWLEIIFRTLPVKKSKMLRYATRLPPNKPVEILDNGLVRKTGACSELKTQVFMEALVKHFIRYPDPLVVPVYEFRLLPKNNGYYSYSYDMMRCGILLPEERALVNLVAELHDMHGSGACQQDNQELHSRAREFPKLFEFLTAATKQDRYWDYHSGNVMMDEDHNYVLIDLEGFTRTPLELYQNNWITRE